jgi:hypothetical protein
MSKLVVHECDSEVFQEFVADKNSYITAVRPHLYIHNLPAGDIKVRLTDSEGRLIAESQATTITTLASNILTDLGTTGAYIHAYVRFDFNVPVRKGVTYRWYVTCFNGYSFAESAYVGVCKDWDNTKKPTTYTPSIQLNAPIDFEEWERVNI